MDAQTVSAAIFVFGCFKGFKVELPGADEELLTSIAILLTTFHNIGQTKGLSLMYNRRIRERLTPEQLVVQAKVEFAERWLFALLTAIIVLRAVNHTYYINILGGYLRWIFFSGILAIILNSLRYPRIFQSGKFVFMQSLWCFVFPMFASGTVALQLALQGIEYVLISERMIKKSKPEMTRFWIVFGMGFMLAFALFGAIDPKMFRETSSILPSGMVPWVIAISLWIEYFHYYVDSQIFRFKDPYVRANVGALLC